MRLKRKHRTFLKALLMVAVTFILLELALRVVDPWGLRYFDDVQKMSREMFVADSERIYGLNDGTFQFSYWETHIADGKRVLPDASADTGCSVAFLGDSITFGHGVNDDQTWVNLIARDLPDVEIVNYGVPRYSSTNALLTRQAFPDHAAYIYIIFNNDSEPSYDPANDAELASGNNRPWLVLYMQLLIRRTTPEAPIDATRFFSEVDDLLAAGRVHLVAFDDDVLTDLVIEREYDMHTVPFPPYPISVSDFHLNPQGNAELAANLLPFVENVADEACAAAGS